jgi:hypothetical protein
MKGISSTVAAVLIATISVTLVGTTYFFSKSMMEKATAETFEVIDIFDNRVIIRNTGTQTIEEFKTLVDGKEVTNTLEEPIQPNGVGTLILDLTGIPAGRHELIIITKSMSQTLIWEFEYVETTTTTTVPVETGSLESYTETEQGEAEVGKPVKWKTRIVLSNPSTVDIEDYIVRLILPEDASNVEIKDEKGKIITREESFGVSIASEKTVEYYVEYETPAPYKVEEEGSPHFRRGYVKTVRVISNASVSYKNVKVSSYFPDRNFKLYHVIGFPMDVTTDPTYRVRFFNDTVEWVVPELSEQEFVLQAATIEILQAAAESWEESCTVFPSCSCSFEGAPCRQVWCNEGQLSASCNAQPCPERDHAIVSETCSEYLITDDCTAKDGICLEGICRTHCAIDCTGSCSYTCESNWYNDDGVNNNGCENAVPRWYTPEINDTQVFVEDVVSFNINWTDITGTTSEGLGINYTWFSWNASGENCDTWENVSGSYTPQLNALSLWFNYTQTILAACEGKTIAWIQYANDSAGRENVTDLQFFTVLDISFNLTLPGETPRTSLDSPPGTQTVSIGLNSSAKTDYFVVPCTLNNNCQDSSTPIFNFMNIGNTVIQWNISVNQTLLPGMVLFGNSSLSPTEVVLANETGVYPWIVGSVDPNDNLAVWLWANFTNVQTGELAIEIYHKSRPV